MAIQSHNLPEDVTVDILLRLPIQSLLRCRSVSKHWYVLLTSPSFIRLHLNRSSNAPKLLAAGYISEREVRGLQQVKIHSLDGDNNKGSSYVRLPFKLPGINNITIQGSCNGLVCLSMNFKRTLAIWNPATRECRSLEVPHCNNPYDKFGIGFVPDTNDYKVVRLRGRVNGGPGGSITLISTYTLSSDSWESNEEVGPDVNLAHSWTYANGFLHWIAREGREVLSIVSLDLRNGVFGQMALPIPCYSPRDIHELFASTNGGLSLVLYACQEGMDGWYEVWVMKEYGVQESWTKQSSFGHFSGLRTVACPKHYRGNGQIIFQENDYQDWDYVVSKSKYDYHDDFSDDSEGSMVSIDSDAKRYIMVVQMERERNTSKASSRNQHVGSNSGNDRKGVQLRQDDMAFGDEKLHMQRVLEIDTQKKYT
ncbi:hypothetical protein RJ640_023680 [Escallonia rubra]|uniref:F-box domain-containing protein n=1 Tax=Escallonia rubra TaxID=112253 RepID=A0AA88RWX1_9ASTE|nr:hypothetical protein RJ640_023680 [Escallonia rubra]